MIGIRGRAEGAAGWAVHATALVVGLLLAGPIVLASHHAPRPASAASLEHQVVIGPPRDPMAFEPGHPATADDGSNASLGSVPTASSAAAVVGGLAFAPFGPRGIGVQAIYDIFGGGPGLTWALRVAHCESRYNPLARNPQSGASGLFQFMPATWQAHFAAWDIWDPYAQARAALDFYNRGATNAWACK